MRWFYFVKSKERVALWTEHYGSAPYADDAFYDCVRLFYPLPTILYDRGYPLYSYYAYLAHTTDAAEENLPEPSLSPHLRVQL